MPCRDWDPTPTTVTVENPEIKRRLDEAVRLLCELCYLLDTSGNTDLSDQIDEIGGLRNWWKQHLKMDAARKKQEEKNKKKQDLIISALTKLTKEEILALGLKKCK